MKFFITLQIIFLTLFGGTTCLLAWGLGHDDVNRIALERLPDEIKTLPSPEDQKAFVKESHAPDDHTHWVEYESKKGRAAPPQSR